jgi:crotonobetaine/carnitine-CoA ligase
MAPDTIDNHDGELTRAARWTTEGQTTIPRLFRKTCDQFPDSVFLDFTGDKHTYREADRQIDRLARGLLALGVQPGERVCSQLENSADAVFLWFAANRIGAVYVPINTDYKGEYLRHQLADCGAKLVVVEADYASRVVDVAEGAPALTRLVVRGGPPPVAGSLQVLPLEALRVENGRPVDSAAKPGDLAMLIYTSGTTGPSKGCMIPHSYACNFGLQNRWHARTQPGDVVWTPGPLFHANAAFGVVLHALWAGATASIYKRFSVTNFWPEMERSGATHVAMLSIMLTLVADAPDCEAARRCHGQIKVLYGSPLGTALKAKWKARFGVQHASQPGYGMTEACMITLVSSYDDGAPGDASGKRTPDYDVRVIDEKGEECPSDVPGEIVVRPNRPGIMFQGYWGRPEATLAATRDLWFHTGDIGKFDENDFFYFVDRKKDYLRRGGENISSFEVEASFRTHPQIAQVAIHSVPSELSEDELKVTCVLKEGANLTEEELCRWSIERLPHFVVPRFVEFRAELPATPTGKIQKYVLRSEGVTPGTWDRQAAGIVVSRQRAKS